MVKGKEREKRASERWCRFLKSGHKHTGGKLGAQKLGEGNKLSFFLAKTLSRGFNPLAGCETRTHGARICIPETQQWNGPQFPGSEPPPLHPWAAIPPAHGVGAAGQVFGFLEEAVRRRRLLESRGCAMTSALMSRFGRTSMPWRAQQIKASPSCSSQSPARSAPTAWPSSGGSSSSSSAALISNL